MLYLSLIYLVSIRDFFTRFLNKLSIQLTLKVPEQRPGTFPVSHFLSSSTFGPLTQLHLQQGWFTEVLEITFFSLSAPVFSFEQGSRSWIESTDLYYYHLYFIGRFSGLCSYSLFALSNTIHLYNSKSILSLSRRGTFFILSRYAIFRLSCSFQFLLLFSLQRQHLLLLSMFASI